MGRAWLSEPAVKRRENRNLWEVRMSVRERRVRDNPPYLEAATTSPGPSPSPRINLWLATPHPDPARRSREVIAVSGWRLGTQTRQAGHDVALPPPCGHHSAASTHHAAT